MQRPGAENVPRYKRTGSTRRRPNRNAYNRAGGANRSSTPAVSLRSKLHGATTRVAAFVGAILLAFVTAIITPIGGHISTILVPSKTAAPPPRVTATQVRYYQPFPLFVRPEPRLAPGLKVTSSRCGKCIALSLADMARLDAFRCFARNQVLDPCFPDSNIRMFSMACANSPWSRDVTIVRLQSPMFPPRRSVSSRALPWGLELSNGDRCTHISGVGPPSVAGMTAYYVCIRGYALGDVNRRSAIWTISSLASRSHQVDRESIAIAWY